MTNFFGSHGRNYTFWNFTQVWFLPQPEAELDFQAMWSNIKNFSCKFLRSSKPCLYFLRIFVFLFYHKMLFKNPQIKFSNLHWIFRSNLLLFISYTYLCSYISVTYFGLIFQNNENKCLFLGDQLLVDGVSKSI